ncbi:MAG: ATP-binding protein [Thiomonas sp.]|nr:ATP-binding protein [Thiomonas sp.]
MKRALTYILLALAASCFAFDVAAQSATEDLQALNAIQTLSLQDSGRARAELQKQASRFEASTDPTVRRTFLDTVICTEFDTGHPDGAQYAIDELMTLARTQRDDVALVLAKAAQAYRLSIAGHPNDALRLLEPMQAVAERIGNPQALWILNLVQGGTLNTAGQYEAALAHILKSMEFAQARPQQAEASLLRSQILLGLIYLNLKNTAQALKSIDDGERRARQLHATSMLAILALNRGNVQSGAGKTAEALMAYRTALRIGAQTSLTALQAVALNNIGDIHLIRKEYQQAEQLERQAQSKYLEAGDRIGASLSRANVGFSLMGQGRVDEGAAEVLAALQFMRDSGARATEEIVLEEFSRMYEAAGRFRDALDIARSQQQLSKSLLSKDREQAIAEMQTRFDTVEREHRIETLAHQNSLKDADLRNHRQLLLAAASGTALTLITGGVILMLYRRTRTANQALLVAQRQAEAALEEKNLFLATASHDLRQPVHAMSLMVEAVRLRNQNPAISPLLAELRTSMQALSQLFNALLDLSRLESGVQRVRKEPVVLSDRFTEVIGLLRESATLSNVRLRVRLPRQPATVTADPVLLHQALLNLVQNAVRYGRGGQVLFGARARGDTWQIEVWDTGIGIGPAEEQRVFSPYYRGATGGQMEGVGHGLGLAVVARSARLMGAPYGVQSRMGKGSRFWLRLPACTPPVSVKPRSDPSPSEAFPFVAGACLVVEDEPSVLQAWRAIMDAWGITTRYAKSAREAHAQLDSGLQPAVIFCDYRLGSGENGFELLRSLLARCPHASGAMVSGEHQAQELMAAESEGYIVLRKPLEPQELRSLLCAWLPLSASTAPQPP